jgi:hypothetical protein
MKRAPHASPLLLSAIALMAFAASSHRASAQVVTTDEIHGMLSGG